MIAEQKNSFIMLVLLGAAIFIYNLGVDIFYARGVEPLPAFEFLYSVIVICGVIWWLKAEAQRSPVTQVYCPGVLITAAWPFIIPYHLLKTRGVRGLLPLFALIGAFVLAKILGAAIYLAFSGSL
jgi:hypothetical protein